MDIQKSYDSFDQFMVMEVSFRCRLRFIVNLHAVPLGSENLLSSGATLYLFARMREFFNFQASRGIVVGDAFPGLACAGSEPC